MTMSGRLVAIPTALTAAPSTAPSASIAGTLRRTPRHVDARTEPTIIPVAPRENSAPIVAAVVIERRYAVINGEIAPNARLTAAK